MKPPYPDLVRTKDIDQTFVSKTVAVENFFIEIVWYLKFTQSYLDQIHVKSAHRVNRSYSKFLKSSRLLSGSGLRRIVPLNPSDDTNMESSTITMNLNVK